MITSGLKKSNDQMSDFSKDFNNDHNEFNKKTNTHQTPTDSLRD